MAWMPGCPHDHGADVDRPQSVPFGVLHRTIGSWPGDYSVGKNRMHSSPGTFNFLVGKAEGEWVQFYDSSTRCSHAAGGNDGCGIEISGQNGEALTDWQIDAVGRIVRWLAQEHGIPVEFRDGDPRVWADESAFRGFITHRAVDYPPNTSYRHYDYVTADEFARMTEGDEMTKDDWDKLGKWMQDQTNIVLTELGARPKTQPEDSPQEVEIAKLPFFRRFRRNVRQVVNEDSG